MGGKKRSRKQKKKSAAPSRKAPPQQGIVCHYAVAIVDILGQGEALKLLDELPIPCAKEQADQVVEKTMKPVLELRHSLHGFFRKAENAPPPPGLPPELQRMVVRMRGWKAIVRSASDTTAMMVSLRGEQQGVGAAPNLGGLYRIMMASAGTHLSMMVNLRIMLRGGLDVGKAFEIPPLPSLESGTDVYGLVLGRAYDLERKTAGYPRIVVGKTLLSMLQQVHANPSPAADWQIARAMAERCSAMLIRDTEEESEIFMLDFLHPRMIRRAGISMDQVRSLRDFVASEHARFGQIPDPTLEDRYRRFLAYCDTGLHRLEHHADEDQRSDPPPTALESN